MSRPGHAMSRREIDNGNTKAGGFRRGLIAHRCGTNVLYFFHRPNLGILLAFGCHKACSGPLFKFHWNCGFYCLQWSTISYIAFHSGAVCIFFSLPLILEISGELQPWLGVPSRTIGFISGVTEPQQYLNPPTSLNQDAVCVRDSRGVRHDCSPCYPFCAVTLSCRSSANSIRATPSLLRVAVPP